MLPEGVYNDYPQSHKLAKFANCSVFKENRLITRFQPSSQTQNKFVLLIVSIFQRILSWLYPLEKTNYVGIVAGLDPHSLDPPDSLTPTQICSYFKRFFQAEQVSCHAQNVCMQQLDVQYRTIEKHRQMKSLSSGSQDGYKEMLASWATKIDELKEGEQNIIIANAAMRDELFYLFSKRDGKVSLKVIGRGSSMAALSSPQEVAGQAQIVASLDYGVVDSRLVHRLLDISALGSKGFNYTECQKLLATLKVSKQERLEIERETHNALSLFLTVFKQMDKNAGKTDADFERTKLRLNVFTLFSLLNSYRTSLKTNLTDIQTLMRMHRICAQNLSLACKRGIVGKTETEKLVAELSVVQQAIDAAHLSAWVISKCLICRYTLLKMYWLALLVHLWQSPLLHLLLTRAQLGCFYKEWLTLLCLHALLGLN